MRQPSSPEDGPTSLYQCEVHTDIFFLTCIELLITIFSPQEQPVNQHFCRDFLQSLPKKKCSKNDHRMKQIGFSAITMPLTTLCTNFHPTTTSAWFKDNHRLHLQSSKKRMLVNASNSSTISGPNALSLGDYFVGVSTEYQVNSVITRKKLSANFTITPLIAVTKMNKEKK